MEFILQVEQNVLAINAEGFMSTDNSLLMSVCMISFPN